MKPIIKKLVKKKQRTRGLLSKEELEVRRTKAEQNFITSNNRQESANAG